MLSYQHGFHAGNFADVLKHTALTRLLAYLSLKEKPYFYFETHSGKGLYDLKDYQAEKTGEYKQGIQLLHTAAKSLPAVFGDYLRVIKALNTNNQLRYYPGSPFLAINALREQDRGYICELHPTEFDTLSTIPRLGKKIHISHSDGIETMKALIPPAERRGLIFIDPSYEVKDDYKDIPKQIGAAYAKFETGVYCLWYPVVNKRLCEQLDRRMKEIGAKNMLKVEFNLTTRTQMGMTGCGLWLINPPFTFAQEIKSVCETLKKYFNPGESSYFIE